MADTESDEEVFADAEMTDEDEADELRNDYVPADRFDASAVKHLSGMYKNWFLDYASYVILERAVPHIDDGLKPVQRRILHSMKRMDDGRYNKVANIAGPYDAVPPTRRCFYLRCPRANGTERPAHRHARKLGKHLHWRPCCGSPIHRIASFQVCIGDHFQPQNHRMAAILRWQKQRTRYPTCQISIAVGARCGRHSCWIVV